MDCFKVQSGGRWDGSSSPYQDCLQNKQGGAMFTKVRIVITRWDCLSDRIFCQESWRENNVVMFLPVVVVVVFDFFARNPCLCSDQSLFYPIMCSHVSYFSLVTCSPDGTTRWFLRTEHPAHRLVQQVRYDLFEIKLTFSSVQTEKQVTLPGLSTKQTRRGHVH